MDEPTILPTASLKYAGNQPTMGIAPRVNSPPAIGGQTMPTILITIKLVKKIISWPSNQFCNIGK
jgi:hypothetical protein